MQEIHFLTGNKHKYKEAVAILPQLLFSPLELPEIQEVDIKKILKEKLRVAVNQNIFPCIVEDTGLYLKGLKGFPGPLIKWFHQVLGNQGIADIVENLGVSEAYAKTVIGYAKKEDEFHFFEGVVEGEIVTPRTHHKGFGWDPIFQPSGQDKTFAEMTLEHKNQYSMRHKAFIKLKTFCI